MSKQYLLSLLASLLLATSPAQAALHPHSLFSDDMVVQRQAKVPVWGTTTSRDRVRVSLAGHEVSVLPKNGRWQVDLPPLEAGGPYVLSIRQGLDTVECKRVLVGEVWICAGQSNMQWPLKQSEGGTEAIAAAGQDQIRLFSMPRRRTHEPEQSVTGAWTPASPDTAGEFSAVGYYFGRALARHMQVPIGLIAANYNGSTAEEWLSAEAVEAHPELQAMSKPQGVGTLYNSMIAPLAPFAMRGAIWYQGESNASRGYQYRTLLSAIIKNWRETFGQEDFPFLLVQMAPYEAIVHEPSDSMWAELRDAQRIVAKTTTNAALVVTTDLGDEKDIHPRRKEPVGARLALAARAIAYDENIEYSGPEYESMTVDADQVTLHFKHVGRGLVAHCGPLTGFTVAGDDQRFYPATAAIEGNKIKLNSPCVANPVAVRFGWAAFPIVNLWNKDGLPATPFRTDTFPVTTQEKK